ncbi:hypothetical protein PPL_08134 [Heterostelium album PN500]|uniref:FNIP repeat-containing protein n=1 Tax=Heterostelium pallidum (strain ATCC 26659 / Pp 5 / PN500) TaxID=670386 RepID=D3BIQ1_HETP5|nr:hypothetical protein PPL_08134 [Heterostelium album PN500]EFA78675.1 hypothetical protein PPL_08134 [Heterostelium album PN500]|eukprot:XP_020430799.1 hypothetical protein PPL_08134 [Heterostelium album PN500]
MTEIINNRESSSSSRNIDNDKHPLNIVEHSRDLKSNCTLFIGFTKEINQLNNNNNIDYYYNCEINNINEIVINENVSNVVFSLCCVNKRVFESCVLYERIASSNADTLEFRCNVRLKAGSIPSNVTTIHFSEAFNEELEVGCLPVNLRHLEFKCGFTKLLRPGVLPPSLKVLKLRYYNKKFLRGVLPNGLETLEFFCRDSNIDDAVLPPTLLTLSGIPSTWLKHIKSLTNIRNIALYRQNTNINLSNIPNTVIDYQLGLYSDDFKLTGQLPSSIQYLDLGTCELDSFINQNNNNNSSNNNDNNVNEEQKDDYYYHFPDNLLNLVIGFSSLQKISPGMIPNTVKDLTLSDNIIHSLQVGSIPDSVEILRLGGNCESIPSNVIPASVKRLTINIEYFLNNTINSLPATIETIVVQFHRLSNVYSFDIRRIDIQQNNNSNNNDENDNINPNYQSILMLGGKSDIEGGFINMDNFQKQIIEIINNRFK